MKKVTVCIFAYNLERFVTRAIESVLMQRTSFEFDILIGEDCSTDKTREICLKYSQIFPLKIKLILREQNVGQMRNVFDTIKTCDSEYIAILDADDYWIDPLKLQKQVDYLDANPEYSLCCHNSIILFDDYDKDPYLFNPFDQKELITIEDIILKWSMATGSMVFRRSAMQFPDLVYKAFNFDIAIQVILADRGKVKYFKDIMSVYSKTKDSNSFNPLYPSDFIYTQQIRLFNEIDEYFNEKYHTLIDKKIELIKKNKKQYILNLKYPYLKYFNVARYIRFIKRIISR